MHSHKSIERVYAIVKFISLGFIILSGIMITNKESIDSIGLATGVHLSTVLIFIVHIIAVITLLSSIIFINIFNLYTNKRIIIFGKRSLDTVLLRVVLPAIILVAGLTGLIIYEPFRWVIPFWAFNLGWDFIFTSKNIHLWLAYLSLLVIAVYLVLIVTHRMKVAK